MKIIPIRSSNLILSKRKELGLTQAQLTQRIGWKKNNTQYISNIERGVCGLPPSSIIEIVAATGMSRDALVDAMVNDYRDSLLKEINGPSSEA